MGRKRGRPKGPKKFVVSAQLHLEKDIYDGLIREKEKARLPVATWLTMLVNKTIGGDK